MIYDEEKCGWEVRYEELHQPGKHVPGPWAFHVHDNSMATLCGGGEDAITGYVMAISPCKACRDKKEGWRWGSCAVPREIDAKLIELAPDLFEYVQSQANKDPAAKALVERLYP